MVVVTPSARLECRFVVDVSAVKHCANIRDGFFDNPRLLRLRLGLRLWRLSSLRLWLSLRLNLRLGLRLLRSGLRLCGLDTADGVEVRLELLRSLNACDVVGVVGRNLDRVIERICQDCLNSSLTVDERGLAGRLQNCIIDDRVALAVAKENRQVDHAEAGQPAFGLHVDTEAFDGTACRRYFGAAGNTAAGSEAFEKIKHGGTSVECDITPKRGGDANADAPLVLAVEP